MNRVRKASASSSARPSSSGGSLSTNTSSSVPATAAAFSVPADFKSTLPPRKRARTQEEKEQRRIERILRNRKAAHQSREKKRLHLQHLEARCAVLESLLSSIDLSTPLESLMGPKGIKLVQQYRNLPKSEITAPSTPVSSSSAKSPAVNSPEPNEIKAEDRHQDNLSNDVQSIGFSDHGNVEIHASADSTHLPSFSPVTNPFSNASVEEVREFSYAKPLYQTDATPDFDHHYSRRHIDLLDHGVPTHESFVTSPLQAPSTDSSYMPANQTFEPHYSNVMNNLITVKTEADDTLTVPMGHSDYGNNESFLNDMIALNEYPRQQYQGVSDQDVWRNPAAITL